MAFKDKHFKQEELPLEETTTAVEDDDFDEDQVDADILETLLSGEDIAAEAQVTLAPNEEVKFDSVIEAQPVVAQQPVATQQPTERKDNRKDEEAVTVITKGTTINGSIISDCSLDVMGTINGDIECLGKLSISGKVVGNSMASEVYVNTDRLEGNINSEGTVKIAQKTVVIGDVTASSGVIAGAVKGEIDISGPVVIDSTAVVCGDVKAKSIQINNGAVLEGHISLSYASGLDISNVFENK